MNKNDIVELNITACTDTGNGIGKYAGMTVFVPSAAVGDKIRAKILKVKKNCAYAKTEEILSPSKDRIIPDCPVFGKCGGCAFRHITYESECAIKQTRVADCIKRIAKIDVEPRPIVPADSYLRYRNKAQYPVSDSGQTGFYSLHSHRIVPCRDCLLQPKSFSLASDAFERFIKETGLSIYDENTGEGLIRHLCLRTNFQGDIMAVVVINGTSLPFWNRLKELLAETLGESFKSLQININTKRNNVILGEKCVTLYGDDRITDSLCGVPIELSPLSFYQVNRPMAQKLLKKAGEYVQPEGKTVLDLYCGAGAVGLSMAHKAKSVIGVEIVKDAVTNAIENAKKAGFDNTEFICADASKAADMLRLRGVKPDAVIVDPPRKGCDASLIKILTDGFAPERIVYISCDPATLARDASLICQNGYTLIEYTPFDLFPRTAHVETAALFLKG